MFISFLYSVQVQVKKFIMSWPKLGSNYCEKKCKRLQLFFSVEKRSLHESVRVEFFRITLASLQISQLLIWSNSKIIFTCRSGVFSLCDIPSKLRASLNLWTLACSPSIRTDHQGSTSMLRSHVSSTILQARLMSLALLINACAWRDMRARK